MSLQTNECKQYCIVFNFKVLLGCVKLDFNWDK